MNLRFEKCIDAARKYYEKGGRKISYVIIYNKNTTSFSVEVLVEQLLEEFEEVVFDANKDKDFESVGELANLLYVRTDPADIKAGDIFINNLGNRFTLIVTEEGLYNLIDTKYITLWNKFLTLAELDESLKDIELQRIPNK